MTPLRTLLSEADLPEPLIAIERTFEGFLDLDWLELTDERAHVRFEVRDDLKQPFGLVHGGVYSAVAESLASWATNVGVWRDGRMGNGMSNSASFLRPVTAGTVEATCLLRSRAEDRWVWSTEFLDEQRRLCALVEVAIAVRPRPAGP